VSELIERRAAESARNDAAVLAALGEAGDRGLSAAELAARTGIAARTVTRRLAELAGRGLVVRDGQRGPVRLTAAGHAESGASAAPQLAGGLDGPVAMLPSEAHRAMLRLMLSAVVARRHLLSRYPTGWPGFIAIGDTKQGKTTLAVACCRVFGIPERKAIKLVQRESPGSLFARRRQVTGGSWTVNRAPLLDMPFACLDELDKADAPLMAAALALLQGDADADVEDTTVAVRPVTYVCLNAGPAGLRVLPAAYVRRSAVLDTTAVAPLLADMDEAAARLLAPGLLPRLDLEQLVPPAAELPPEVRDGLRQALRGRLTPEGWQLADVESVARLALGRAAFPGSGGLSAAAAATVADYLATAATLGHTIDGWASGLREWLDQAREDGAVMVPDLGRHRAEVRRLEAARQDRAADAQRESAGLAAGRAELAARLREDAATLDARRLRPLVLAPLRAEAAGARAALAGLAGKAAASRSQDSLDAVAVAAAEWTARAAGIRARMDAARQQNEHDTAAERTRRDQERRDAAAQAARDKDAAARARKDNAARVKAVRKRGMDQLRQVRRAAKELEGLYRRSGHRTGDPLPFARLTALRWPDGRPLLEYRPDASTPRRRLARLLPEQGTWQVTGSTATFRGWHGGCKVLDEWGKHTRAVLAPALRELHRQEDKLCAALAAPPRYDRPALPPAPQVAGRPALPPASLGTYRLG
jgi:DNA-binding transcriptional ArsR family regulator